MAVSNLLYTSLNKKSKSKMSNYQAYSINTEVLHMTLVCIWLWSTCSETSSSPDEQTNLKCQK